MNIGEIWEPNCFNILTSYPISAGGYKFGYLPQDLRVKIVDIHKLKGHDNIVLRNGDSPTTLAYDKERFLSLYKQAEREK